MQQRIGDFDVLDVLGEGTVGTVYRARHHETGQPAAIKLLKKHMAAEPDVQRRFVREVAICEKLDHPNIVRHYDCGLHDDQIYFAMEQVGAGTIKEILRRRQTLPWREAAEVAMQICQALEYAHREGIIHRDLKPGNLFLSDDGRVKVGDFGLARDLSGTRLTLEGITVGTCRYMPPEQISGDANLTGAVDRYALGCILHEMLTGKPPFDGETIVDIFEQHINTPAPRVSSTAADFPSDLADLVAMLLAKNPQDRPPSAAAVEQALADILRGRPMQLNRDADQEAHADASTSDYQSTNLTERLQSSPANEEREITSKQWAIILGTIATVIVLVIVASRL